MMNLEFAQFMAGINLIDKKFFTCMDIWVHHSQSAGTIHIRKCVFVRFFRYYRRQKNQHPCFAGIDSDILRAFFNQLMARRTKTGKPYAKSTIANHHSIMNSFFLQAYREKLIPHNYMDFVKRPTGIDKNPPDILTDEELEKILSYLASKITKAKAPSRVKLAVMRYVMVWTYGTIGPRFRELANATIADFIDSSNPLLRLNTKGNRTILKAVPDSTAKLLRDWIGMYRRGCGPDELIFCAPYRDTPLCHTSVYEWIRDAAKACGIMKRLATHSLRASLLTRMHVMGADIFEIQAAAGHKKPETTFDYIRIAQLGKGGAVRRYDLSNIIEPLQLRHPLEIVQELHHQDRTTT